MKQPILYLLQALSPARKQRTQLPFRTLLCSALLLLASASDLSTQLVADGATAIINGTSTNITGNLTIGTNGDFTQLVIINGGAVTNVSSGSGSSGYIGLNPGADN